MSNPLERRHKAPRLAIFNHKGGVGKTTLTVNIAAAVSDLGLRVLLVDSDPQANLSSYLIEEAVVNDLLDQSDTPAGNTLWSGVKPVVEGAGEIRQITAIERVNGMHLLAGDIRLAEFEAELASFWAECFQRRVRGFRGTTALSSLVNRASATMDADLVIFDSGPNIGALNRVILLDCEYFVIPAAADLFSLRAIKTLGHTLASWVKDWRTISELAPDGLYLLPGRPKLVGYIPQRFKVYGGRPAHDYATMFPRIERAIQEDVLAVLKRVAAPLGSAAASPLKLGEIKDFGTLANASQRQGVPMWLAEAGSQDQRTSARESFAELAEEIAHRTGIMAR